MKQDRQDVGSAFWTVCILIFLGGFTICNLDLGKTTWEKLFRKDIVFSEFVQEIHSVYTSDKLALKDEFVNLNGLFGLACGRREYNEVVMTHNGMLTQELGDENIELEKRYVKELAQYLEEGNIPFVYVQAPYKQDLTGKMIPEGVDCFANDKADEMLKYLTDSGIYTMDMRPVTSATAEMVEQYFYRTDHHWNYEGAFVAFQQIVRWLDEMFPKQNLEVSYAELQNWQKHTLKDWFLGSLGKRVGCLYGGIDDFTWFTPNFETNMSLSIGKRGEFYKGTFEEAIIRERYLENKDYFRDNTYCLYLGGSAPVVKIQNSSVKNDMKIVVIGDSFSRPVYAFLSTIVSEVDALDPRYLPECSVAEYIELAKPDLVLFLTTPTMYTKEDFWNFGVLDGSLQQDQNDENYNVVEKEHVKVEAKSLKNNCEQISLQQGKKYILTIDDVIFEQKDSEVVEVSVYNETTKTKICSNVFDVAFCREKKEFCWVFHTPQLGNEDEIILQFYAGRNKETEDIGITYENVSLFFYDNE